jgi:hypothetical protein
MFSSKPNVMIICSQLSKKFWVGFCKLLLSSPAESFLVPSVTGLMTKLYGITTLEVVQLHSSTTRRLFSKCKYCVENGMSINSSLPRECVYQAFA